MSPDRLRRAAGGRSRGRESGLAIVEFVVAAPLLLFVMIATAEFGRAFYQYTALTKAVRDGARYLASQGGSTSGVFNLGPGGEYEAAQRVTVFGVPNGGTTPILPGFAVGNVQASRVGTTDYVQVTATYNFQALFVPIPGLGVGTGNLTAFTTLTATATQRWLR